MRRMFGSRDRLRSMAVCRLSVVLIFLSGCAQVSYPDLNTPQSGQVDSPETARAYIAQARSDLVQQKAELRFVEGGLDAGIVGGGIAALTGGLLGFSRNYIVRTTLIAAGSLGLDQAIQPRAQEQVLDRGLSALDCLDGKAEAAYPVAAQASVALIPVKQAITTLEQDINSAIQLNEPSFADPIATAQKNLAIGKQFVASREPGTYQAVRLATNSIITTVNTQLGSAQPDPLAVAQAIHSINLAQFTPSGGASPALTPPATPSGSAAQQALSDTMKATGKDPIQTLQQDTAALQTAMNNVASNPSPPPTGVSETLTSLSSCTPGTIVLKISPSGEIDLAQGSTYDLMVTGGSSQWSWSGPNPPGVTVTALSSTHYQVSAASGAASQAAIGKPYGLLFTPLGGGDSVGVTLKVVAGS